MSLLQVLKTESLRVTGTIRADCLGNDPKISKKDIKNEAKGSIETYHEACGNSVVFWNDNDFVIVISNVHSDLPHITAKHCSPTNRSYKQVSRPNCVSVYNKHMGGVSWEGVYHIDVCGKSGTGPTT